MVSVISESMQRGNLYGSEYSIKNGAVLAGPAPRPLPAKQIKITGGSIFLE